MIGGRRISIIATVRNERHSIVEWLDALLCQTALPDEIVVVDGGSTDGTLGALRQRASAAVVPLVVRSSSGSTIAAGRNEAIQHASGDIIVVTDAGTIAESRWLESLVDPLLGGESDVASGFFVPRRATRWERALAAATLPEVQEINPPRFLPSSRSVAFRRAWFEAGIRYPEWLDYCEDLVWDLAMLRAGARLTFVPDARVTFVVRPSAMAYAMQYFRYARGDGKAGLFARRHVLRYAAYGVLLVTLARHRWHELALVSALGLGYMRTPIQRSIARDARDRHGEMEALLTVLLVGPLRILGDLAKMSGYPVGLFWRVQQFGTIGRRSTWQRVSPSGQRFRPGALSRESQPRTGSPDAGSHAVRR